MRWRFQLVLGVVGFVGTTFLLGSWFGRQHTRHWNDGDTLRQYLWTVMRLTNAGPDHVALQVTCGSRRYAFDSRTSVVVPDLDDKAFDAGSVGARGDPDAYKQLLELVGTPVSLASSASLFAVIKQDAQTATDEASPTVRNVIYGVLFASAGASVVGWLGYRMTYRAEPDCGSDALDKIAREPLVWEKKGEEELKQIDTLRAKAKRVPPTEACKVMSEDLQLFVPDGLPDSEMKSNEKMKSSLRSRFTGRVDTDWLMEPEVRDLRLGLTDAERFQIWSQCPEHKRSQVSVRAAASRD